MLQTPPLLMPDAVKWAVAYLRAALTARAESYTDDVYVRTEVGATIPSRLVTIRDDSGPRLEVTKSNALGVNVWAESEQTCSDLARMVVALLEASPGNGPVVAHTSTFGPYPVDDDNPKPHRYASVVLAVRGSAL